MRKYIEYLETLKRNSKNKKEVALLEDLIIRAEAAFSTELWSNVPVQAPKIIQRTIQRNTLCRVGMEYID